MQLGNHGPRGILASVVDENHFIPQSLKHTVYARFQFPQAFFFVEQWHDDCHGHCGLALHGLGEFGGGVFAGHGRHNQ